MIEFVKCIAACVACLKLFHFEMNHGQIASVFFFFYVLKKKLLCVVCLHYRVTRPDLIFGFIPVHTDRIINF